jgi:hypothetical protein
MNGRRLKTLACIITVALGMPVSCATNKPEMAWVRTDGKRIGNDPDLLKQGQTDIAVCNANLDAVRSTKGGEIVWRRRATLWYARTKQSRHEQDTRHRPLSLLKYLPRMIGRVVMGQSPRMILASVVLVIGVTLSSSQEVLRAQEVDKPAIPPQPRTINLTQEQRFVIKENVWRCPRRRRMRQRRSAPQCRQTLCFTPYRRTSGSRCRKYARICFSSKKAITPSCLSVPAIVELLT